MRGGFAITHEDAMRDKLFVARPTTPDAGDTFLADFDWEEQIPSIIACKNLSGTGVKRSILRSLTLEQVRPERVADVSMLITVAVDPAYRYSSGGEQVTAVSMRPSWDATATATDTSELEVYFGSAGGVGGIPEIAVTAESSLTRYVPIGSVQGITGVPYVIDFEGETWVDDIGAVLIYIWADDMGTITGEFRWKLDFVEETLPS